MLTKVKSSWRGVFSLAAAFHNSSWGLEPPPPLPACVFLRRILMLGIALTAVSIGYNAAVFLESGAWQKVAAAGGVAPAALCLVQGRRHGSRGGIEVASCWFVAALWVPRGSGRCFGMGRLPGTLWQER